jgi:hypothetical protein
MPDLTTGCSGCKGMLASLLTPAADCHCWLTVQSQYGCSSSMWDCALTACYVLRAAAVRRVSMGGLYGAVQQGGWQSGGCSEVRPDVTGMAAAAMFAAEGNMEHTCCCWGCC